MKKQLFILCILLAPLFTFGQNAEMARAYYTKAKEAYSQQDYQQALKYLENAKEQLGSTNPDITYMEIKSKNGLGEFDEDLDILINDFLQKSDADDDRRTEMNMLLIDLEEKREAAQKAVAEKERIAEEARQAEEIRKAEETRQAEEAEKRKIEETIAMEKGLIQTMVKVEGGTFKMGSKKGDKNLKPVHEVTLNTFYIGKYSITQEQWTAVMGSKYGWNCHNCPAISISWDDAQKFLKKLNQITGKKYRLPTEAEWEYAARGGYRSNGYTFSGSNKLDEVAWYKGNSNNRIQAVGQKKGNELGIYDMSGNVKEWCYDWYDEDYYRNSSKNNPQGPSYGRERVVRGGSYLYEVTELSGLSLIGGSLKVVSNASKLAKDYCEVFQRSYRSPSSTDSNQGFRVVLSED